MGKSIYPNLVAEMARRGIKRPTIAAVIGISDRALRGRMAGTVNFDWMEVCKIHAAFFPEVDIGVLFERDNEAAPKPRRCSLAPVARPAP